MGNYSDQAFSRDGLFGPKALDNHISAETSIQQINEQFKEKREKPMKRIKNETKYKAARIQIEKERKDKRAKREQARLAKIKEKEEAKISAKRKKGKAYESSTSHDGILGEMQKELEQSAIKMQALYRGNKGRKLFQWKKNPKAQRAANLIKKILKGRIARRRFLLVVEAARRANLRKIEDAKKKEKIALGKS